MISYHCCICSQGGVSDSKEHDQAFVFIAISKMLSTTNTSSSDAILIESDNCSGQFKSAEHFHDLQNISNRQEKTVVWFYGVEGHGKGEVDHVGGIAKVSARNEMARGKIFNNASDIVQHLINQFGTRDNPEYHITEGTVGELEEERESRRRKVYKTIKGSALWHVMIFKPGQAYFVASPRLCICDECASNYGSCALFTRYELDVCELRDIPLRSDDHVPIEKVGESEDDGFIVPGMYVALRADDTDDDDTTNKSNDMFWLVKITAVNQVNTEENVEDSYHYIIPKGTIFFTGHFLERITIGKRYTSYKLEKDKFTHFYKESVVFPFVNITEGKKCLILKDEDYTDILVYIEQQGLVHV